VGTQGTQGMWGWGLGRGAGDLGHTGYVRLGYGGLRAHRGRGAGVLEHTGDVGLESRMGRVVSGTRGGGAGSGMG